MKNIQLTLVALLVLAVPAFAQQRGGHQAIPARGPAPVRSVPAQHMPQPSAPQQPRDSQQPRNVQQPSAPQQQRNFSISPATPTCLTSTVRSGSVTIRDPMIPITTSISPSPTAASPVALAAPMFGGSPAEALAASGSTAGIGMSLQPTSPSVTDGSGTPTRSSSTKTLTIQAGISPTTFASVLTCTSSISACKSPRVISAQQRDGLTGGPFFLSAH